MSCGSNDSDPNHYKIEVQASGLYNGVRAQLQAIEGANRMVTDTAVIINGKFKFEGYTDGVALRTLTVNGVMGQLPIILEPGQTKILLFKDSITKSKISGTHNNATFNKFKLAMDEEIKILNDIEDIKTRASLKKIYMGAKKASKNTSDIVPEMVSELESQGLLTDDIKNLLEGTLK